MTYHGMGAALVSTTENAPVVFSPGSYQQSIRDMARLKYAEGQTAFDAGNFDAAIRGFTAAYRLIPHVDVLYAIGMTLSRLGRPAEAIGRMQRVLQAYEDSGDHDLPASRRGEIGTEIDRARAAMRATGQTSDAATLPPPTAKQLQSEQEAVQAPPPAPPRNATEDSMGRARATTIAIWAGTAVGAAGLIGLGIWLVKRK